MLRLLTVCTTESESLEQCIAVHPTRMPSLSCTVEVEKKAVGAGLQLLWSGEKLPLLVRGRVCVRVCVCVWGEERSIGVFWRVLHGRGMIAGECSRLHSAPLEMRLLAGEGGLADSVAPPGRRGTAWSVARARCL